MNSFFSFIFLGDTHGYVNDFEKQKELIEEINPEIILCESMQNISLDSNAEYNKLINSKFISDMVTFEEIEKLILLCRKKKIKLIGIDFYNYGFGGLLANKIKNGEECTPEEELLANEIVEMRERFQLESIKKFENVSKKPILVFIGAWHLRDDSPILMNISNWKMVFPCDKNKNILIGLPENNEKIYYSERVK